MSVLKHLKKGLKLFVQNWQAPCLMINSESVYQTELGLKNAPFQMTSHIYIDLNSSMMLLTVDEAVNGPTPVSRDYLIQVVHRPHQSQCDTQRTYYRP